MKMSNVKWQMGIAFILALLIVNACQEPKKKITIDGEAFTLEEGRLAPKETRKVSVADAQNTPTKASQNPLEVEMSWEEQQLTLRAQILDDLENTILKESFLQEMYIRHVAKLSRDTVYIDIGFDLHGNDCGAFDCYSTDVSFSIILKGSFQFPQTLPFKEDEYGCVQEETHISGIFKLEDSSINHVKYVSTEHKRTLVLFRDNSLHYGLAYYFNGIDPERVDVENLDKLLLRLEEPDENELYPYQSFALRTNSYEWFTKKGSL